MAKVLTTVVPPAPAVAEPMLILQLQMGGVHQVFHCEGLGIGPVFKARRGAARKAGQSLWQQRVFVLASAQLI